MKAIWITLGFVLAAASVAHFTPAGHDPKPAIVLLRAPGGIEPQTALDGAGALHMVYFKGDASGGDIEYVRRDPGQKNFASPIRVNSAPATAVAIGTVRGPQMSVGRNGRVYVIWFGSSEKTAPEAGMPIFFSRLNDARTAFEPQRNLMRYTQGGDGGLSVAADLLGHVYAVWHAFFREPGEEHRRVYLASSADDGRSFSREVPVSPPELGACGCCGMRAFVDASGTLYVLFRAAAQGVHRDMTLLASSDRGRTFRTTTLGPWELNACPMSTAYLSEGRQRLIAAWEKAGQVYFGALDSGSFALVSTVVAPGDARNQKHPAVAANQAGQVLMAWTEGAGWSKGGSLVWQLFDPSGKPVGETGRLAGLPAWDLPSVFTDQEGNFVVAY